MFFCCPRCQREEEIIGDRKPRCMKCHVEMIPPSDYSQVSMSPYTAIVRMRTVSERCGIDRARTDGRFKREREAWAAGVLALALSKLKDDVWWVEVETVDATPDTKLRQIDQTQTHSCPVEFSRHCRNCCDDRMICAHGIEIKDSTGPESLAFSGEFVPYWVGIQLRRTQSSTSS